MRALHLPIHPSPAHPDSGKLLFLEDGLCLNKNTNVKLETRYLVPTSLINFRYRDSRSRQKFRLQPQSLKTVLSAVNLTRPAQSPAGIEEYNLLIRGPEPASPSTSSHTGPIPGFPSLSTATSSNVPHVNVAALYEAVRFSRSQRPATHTPKEHSGTTITFHNGMNQYTRSQCYADLERAETLPLSRNRRGSDTAESSCALCMVFVLFLAIFLTIVYWFAHAKA